ncbi:MAG: hypothetical protein V7L29_14185 [Nostoc sp.]|uniref:hypothetical protein n=1 Tax=Nostoc sp. TaxID=1180 RepID=UPI002FF6C314
MGAINTSRLAASLVRLTRAIASSRRWRKSGSRVSNSEAAIGKLIVALVKLTPNYRRISAGANFIWK